MNYQPQSMEADMAEGKEVQDVVGEALDLASRSTRKASKALQELDMKKAAIEALLQGADSVKIVTISNIITDAKQSLADAEASLIAAHIEATALTMDEGNNMSTRSGRTNG